MSLKPFSACVVPEQTASIARRAFPEGSLCISGVWLRHNLSALRSPEWIASSGYQKSRQSAFPAGLRQSATRRVDHRRALQKLLLFEPSLRLLINNIPRRQIVRHHSPGRSGADDPSQAIKNLAQGMLALWSVFGHQGQIGGDKRTFGVTDISWVRLPFHEISLPRSSKGRRERQSITNEAE
jgi:hypothetical protein